jgi:hypothetical protein
MRKLAAAALLVFAVLGIAAQSASADVTNPSYQTINYGPRKEFKCITPPSNGVFRQFGAWGDFIDGCTVQLSCPRTSVRCTAWMSTTINAYGNPAVPVTQNGRIRRLDANQRVVGFKDRSCSGTSVCQNITSLKIPGGQYGSVQCNGVRAHVAGAPRASNTCSIRMDYEES